MTEINKVHFIIISAADDGQRTDNFIRKRYPDLPKSRIYQMLRKGEVRLNKKRVKPESRIRAGDTLRMPPVISDGLRLPEIPKYWQQCISESVLYEDDHFLILNKPAGLPVHGGSGQHYGLIDVVRQIWGTDYAELAHRLDRDTSGAIVLGKNRAALAGFQQLMQTGCVEKRYWCLVNGKWPANITETTVYIQKGQIQGGERMVVSADEGQEARTQFYILHCYQQATLLEALLETGRTHQIRVSVQHTGFGIAGDNKYGNRDFNRKIRQLGFQGMFLHAKSVRFTYADTCIQVDAPLPEQAENLLLKIEENI